METGRSNEEILYFLFESYRLFTLFEKNFRREYISKKECTIDGVFNVFYEDVMFGLSTKRERTYMNDQWLER